MARRGIEVDLREAEQLFTRADRTLTTARPILAQILDVIEEGSAEQFASGKGWAALKADYRKRKAADGHGTEKMIYSGDLMRSLTDRNAPGATVKFDGEGVQRGSNLPQAFQQRQGRKGSRARDPLKQNRRTLNERSVEAVLGFLGREINGDSGPGAGGGA